MSDVADLDDFCGLVGRQMAFGKKIPGERFVSACRLGVNREAVGLSGRMCVLSGIGFRFIQ